MNILVSFLLTFIASCQAFNVISTTSTQHSLNFHIRSKVTERIQMTSSTSFSSSTESKSIDKESTKFPSLMKYYPEPLKRPSAVLLGTTSAWLLQQNWNLASPLVAAATVGFASSPVSPLKGYQAPLYCGAFAGTTSIGIVHEPRIALGLALITATMFETFERKKLFPGRGGRLGMCATISSTILTLLSGRLDVFTELKALFVRITTEIMTAPDFFNLAAKTVPGISNIVVPSFTLASLGAIVSTFLRRKGLGPVPSSAICGLIGTLFIKGSVGGLFYMGSFIGMSADANDAAAVDYPSQVLAAILATSFFLGLGQYILAGVGGKLGAAALCGVLASSSIIRKAAVRERLVGTIKKYRHVYL